MGAHGGAMQPHIRARLRLAEHEAAVIALVQQYLDSWTVAEWGSLPAGIVPRRLRSGKEINAAALVFTHHRLGSVAGPRDPLMQEVTGVLCDAVSRLAQLEELAELRDLTW